MNDLKDRTGCSIPRRDDCHIVCCIPGNGECSRLSPIPGVVVNCKALESYR
jgi:hypothetical protein